MSNKNVGAEKLAKDTVAYQQYKEPVNNKGQFDWKKQTKEFWFKKNRRQPTQIIKKNELGYTLNSISKCCHCPTSVTYIFHSTFSTFKRYLHDESSSDNHYSSTSEVNKFCAPYSYYVELMQVYLKIKCITPIQMANGLDIFCV